MNTKKGYGVFGEKYEYMFINDLHDKNSIDHELLKNMVHIDNVSIIKLYDYSLKINENIIEHELYQFAQNFKGESELQTVRIY